MADEHKRCPFCGAKGEVKNVEYLGRTEYRVECRNCGARPISTSYETKVMAWKVWDHRAIVDFSRYVGHLAPELLRKIDAAVLDSVEPQLNALGWVKERTCHIVEVMNCAFLEFHCSECGLELPDVDEYHYCPNCGARVVSEEEQGHMVADAIRRLEKAVEP